LIFDVGSKNRADSLKPVVTKYVSGLLGEAIACQMDLRLLNQHADVEEKVCEGMDCTLV
jgi:hypothetical protein